MYKSQAEAVKDWLLAYRAEEAEIAKLKEERAMLKARMTSISAQELSDMPRPPSNPKDRMSEYMIRLEALETKIAWKSEYQEICRFTIQSISDRLSGRSSEGSRALSEGRCSGSTRAPCEKWRRIGWWQEMVVDEVVQRFFSIKGDNVFFKGLDTGEDVGGVPHPLFDQWIGQSAAKYLSSDERKIAFDDELGTFVITR